MADKVENEPGKGLITGLWWKIGEMAVLLVFIGLIYHREVWVIDEIRGDRVSNISQQIELFLIDRQFSFLPGRFWLTAIPLFLAAFAYLVLDRFRWYFLGLAGMVVSFIITADRIYNYYFSSVVSAASFQAAHQLWDIRGSVAGALPLGDMFWVLLFAIFVVYGRTHQLRGASPLKARPGFFAYDKILGFLMALAGGYGLALAFYIPNRHVTLDLNYQLAVYETRPEGGTNLVPPYQSSHREFAVLFGLLNFHLNDLMETIAHKPAPLTKEQLAGISTQLEHKKRLNDLDSPFFGVARNRNVFLISLESLQHFLLDLELDGREVTPTLNRLRKEGLSFERFLDQAKMGGTSDAEFALMTGLLPDVRGIASLSVPAHYDIVGMPATVREAGYRTLSLHAYRASFWNRNINHPRYGFDKMIFDDAFQSEEVVGWGVPDHDYFAQSLAYLKQEPQPFLAFLIALSSHHPYPNVPEAYQNLFPTLPSNTEPARYLELANYSDNALAGFLESARAAGYWENSLFIIYGDHIAPMTENGVEILQKHTGIAAREPRQLRVPMIFLIPGREDLTAEFSDTYRNTIGGLQDIFPTVCHLLGLETPFGVFGTNLFVPNAERDPIVMMRVGGAFAYNNILYGERPTNPYRDDRGLIWGDETDLVPANSKIHENLLEQFTLHFAVFEHDAQARAIKARKQKAENPEPE
ncbi:MAG: LTA synthase family protein [Acidobacteriota bacterium]|nr:LTA synthase family protein [Acidobacteriota bacterium]